MRNHLFLTLEVVTIPSSKWRSSRSLVLTFTLRQRSVCYTLSFSILTSIFLFLPNSKQQGVVLLKVACEFEYFSIQFPNKMFHYVIMFLSFYQEMILSINLTVQVNWFVCMKLAFSSLHALWKHPSFSHKFTL